ncbi:MAG: endolytic transglycosylase MltG [Actinomycetota bacterium]
MTTTFEDHGPPPDAERRRSRGRRFRDEHGRRRVLLVVLVLVVVPLAFIAIAATWFWWQLDPPGSAGETVEVRIDDGWSVSRIGDELNDRGVIGSSFVFNVYARLSGSSDFQAGTYDLKRDMGVRDAAATLEEGPRIDYLELAVPPGLWVDEIAARVQELPGRSGETFLESTKNGSARSKYQPETAAAGARNPLEGLLWPDTYRVAESEDEIDVLASMVEQFDVHADEVSLAGASTEGRTPYEILVVASLIESEAKVDGDRPLIASVIYNRLRDGMPLQIDATVLYAVGDAEKQTITVQDLDFDSPYNTYKVPGLPPTPIASVTQASLQAAISPAATDFLYYVIANADGSHAFAETFEEHEANIEAARAQGLL